MDFSDDIHTLAIIGPSGGGKSTLLRILGGLIPPTAGRVAVGGEELTTEESALQKYRQKLGFVFQQGVLFRHLSAMENITLPLEQVQGYTRQEAESRVEELLEHFGLGSEGRKKPGALSGGQQRVAIARAVAARPRLLLLDEPTSALDPEYTNEVLDVIHELQSEGIDFVIGLMKWDLHAMHVRRQLFYVKALYWNMGTVIHCSHIQKHSSLTSF